VETLNFVYYCLHSKGFTFFITEGLLKTFLCDDALKDERRHSLDVRVKAASLLSCFIVAFRITSPPSSCTVHSTPEMVFSLEQRQLTQHQRNARSLNITLQAELINVVFITVSSSSV
jgi:hypothetical protein